MSFYDDLNNFVHNYPYTNYHEVVLDFLQNLVAELQKIVEDADLEHIQERLAAIDSALASDGAKISALESASAAAADAINALRTITTNQAADLELIHSQIDGVIEQISEAVETLQGEMADITTDFESFKNTTNTAISTLNQAAFDPSQIVMSNMPFNFALSMIDGSKRGIRIVVDGSGSQDDSIQWVDGATWYVTNVPDKQRFLVWHKIPRFYSSGNAAHLVIPSVFPNVYRTGATWPTLYFYCHRWGGEWSDNSGLNKVGPIAFNDMLAEGGAQVTATPDTGPFNDIELVKNESTGCYDLHIYNGRNGYTYYGDVMFDNMMILPLDLGNIWEQAPKQKYFNLLNTFMVQSGSVLESQVDALTNQISAERTARNSADVLLETSLTECMHGYAITAVASSLDVTISANRSAYTESVDYTSGDKTRMVYINITADIADLANNTDVNICQLTGFTGANALQSAYSLNVDIQKANNGSYATIGTDGTIAIHAYNTSDTSFGASTRIRITGAICDIR